MLRGLYRSWKLPLSYYITHFGMEPEKLKEIMEGTVKKLLEIHLDPKLMVCDQGPQNRKYYANELKISKECVKVKIAGKSIFCIFDPPHVMKSIRNNLLNGYFIDGEGKKIMFSDFRKAYEIDIKSGTSRSMPKITPRHLRPNAFQRMSCPLAFQTFSNSVSATIKTAVQTGELKSETALNTADFFLRMNNVFDSLNSRNLYDPNPYRRPLSDGNIWHFELFEETINYFENLVKVRIARNKKTNLLTEVRSRPPCFDGLIITIRGILGLFQQERDYWGSRKNGDLKSNNVEKLSENNSYFLLTNRCSQDPLEHFFSIMRQNGCNNNPSAKAFRCRFGHISTMSFFKFTDLGNCEADTDCFLDLDPNSLNKIKSEDSSLLPQTNEVSSIEEIDDDDDEDEYFDDDDDKDKYFDDDEEEPFDLDKYIIKEATPTLETCSNVYVAGYVAHETINEFNCGNCQKILLDQTKGDLPDAQKILIVFKTFENITKPEKGLKVPSASLVDVVSLVLRTCSHAFNKAPQIKNFGSKIFNLCLKRIKNQYRELFETSNQCPGPHLDSLINLLIRTKIYKDCKRLNEELKLTTDKKKKNENKTKNTKVAKDPKEEKLRKIQGKGAR